MLIICRTSDLLLLVFFFFPRVAITDLVKAGHDRIAKKSHLLHSSIQHRGKKKPQYEL